MASHYLVVKGVGAYGTANIEAEAACAGLISGAPLHVDQLIDGMLWLPMAMSNTEHLLRVNKATGLHCAGTNPRTSLSHKNLG